MSEQEDTRKKSRRDLLLVLLILPFGILCMFMTGQVAIRLAPEWILRANMRSFLDPDAEFAAGINPFLIEPLNPGILTQPAWGDLFLTPNATIPTRVISSVTLPPPSTHTPPPPLPATPVDKPIPTATLSGPIIQPTRGGPLQADLLIEKSDNSRTYTPGAAINYTILVTNLGPDSAPRFNIIDNIPAVITGLTVNCTPAELCGTNTSSGNRISYTGATLPSSGVITISISGIVAAGATGDLVNIASVAIPSGVRVTDPNPDNNTVTDRDTQLSVYDLAITKTDAVDTYTLTAPLNYTIVVTNNGPSDALGINISDNIPSEIASWTWTCVPIPAFPTATCTASGSNSINDTVYLPAGASITYTINATVNSAATGELRNTANVFFPSSPGFVDPNLTNNSATDIDIPYIDLLITKTDVPAGNTYTPGSNINYTVIVTNNSAITLNGVTVTDNIPILIDPLTWTWTCAPAPVPPGASCTTGPSSGNINDTAVNLPAGTSVIYSIGATVNATANGALTNTATVSPPAGIIDSNMGNNTATDTNNRQVEYVSGPPDGNLIGGPETGTYIDFTLNTPLTIDGNNSDYEIVFYERERPGNIIELDQIIISIGDGTNWYVVYYWGDNIVDTNASPPGSTSEVDNFPISTSLLYGSPYQTGILIDADGGIGTPPNGAYQYIRVTAPPGDTDGGCEIDTIGIWP